MPGLILSRENIWFVMFGTGERTKCPSNTRIICTGRVSHRRLAGTGTYRKYITDFTSRRIAGVINGSSKVPGLSAFLLLGIRCATRNHEGKWTAATLDLWARTDFRLTCVLSRLETDKYSRRYHTAWRTHGQVAHRVPSLSHHRISLLARVTKNSPRGPAARAVKKRRGEWREWRKKNTAGYRVGIRSKMSQ